MDEGTSREAGPPPPTGFLADHPLKVNPLTAWAYRKVWDLRNPSTRFLFFATTGRSGTRTFVRILETCSGVRAFHEPRPKMNGDLLIARQTGRDADAWREYRVRKSVNIRRGATGADWYAEANHLFLKSFHDFVMRDLGDRVSVVHLRRDPVEVAASMARLPEIPGTPAGAKWYLDWRREGNLLDAADLLEDGAPFERCLWYWYETEARVRRFRERHPGVPVHPFSWSRRMDPARVGDLLRRIGLEPDPERLEEICRVRTNTKDDEKAAFEGRVPAERDLADLHERHERFFALLRERDPDLPGFEDGEEPA